MSFLDNSTNNIILDSVITDAGREALAKNNNSFSFVKIAFGDDDVDYTIIKKFGREVGKEKIEKNTPVSEALTKASLAQKYRLISISNPNLVRLPSLSLTGENVGSGNVVSIGARTTKTSTLTISQAISNENTIDAELRDQAFEIRLNNNFLQIQNNTPDLIDGANTAYYLLRRDDVETSIGGSRLIFTIEVKSISNDTFQIFGTQSDKTLIRTFVRVRGIQSGAVLEMEVQIDKDT